MGTASQAIDGPASLLQAKLTPPALPRGLVPRAVLVDAVHDRDADHLVSVTSAAGYGKTTLLAEWASRDERPVAWVTLDLRDNDPVELISCIAAAFAPTQGLPSSFWESMSSPGGSVLGRLGPRLAAAFAEADQPYIVVLDDLHEVTSLSCHDVIDLLVRSVPDGSVFAVAGRKEPPGLASWRVRANRCWSSAPKTLRSTRMNRPTSSGSAVLPCQRSRPERCTTRSKVGWRDCNWP